MGAACPKQYLPLAGQPLIRYALATLAAVPAIEKVYVVLAPDDEQWPGFADLSAKLVVLRCGGATRAETVANGLAAMAAEVGNVTADDWVLVHDAARACLTVAHVESLIREVGDDAVGGILAVPVADTLKREADGKDSGRIAATVPREKLWQAQTPQMFRYGVLLEALHRAAKVTDEASAIEATGAKPLLVEGSAMNFKVCYPADLELAALILASQHG